MKNNKQYDVIIVGGSYAGLAAGMALGRALKSVLIIDSGQPCNRQTPHSHNFLTQDGNTPSEIQRLAKQQTGSYGTVEFLNNVVTQGVKTENGFEVQMASDGVVKAKKLVFATGIKDLMSDVPGFSACWGISVLHCPYCHGYEVRNQTTGILGNGDTGFELVSLISNWTNDLTLYTNGTSTLSHEQTATLRNHNINIVEEEIETLVHRNGYLQNIMFKGGRSSPVNVLYARPAFVQHCQIPESLGAAIGNEGYIQVDSFQETTVEGVYACGDNVTRMRTVANAVAMGTTAGIAVSRALIFEAFQHRKGVY